MIKLTYIMRLMTYMFAYLPGIRYLLQPYSAFGFLRAQQALIFRTYGGPWSGAHVFGNLQKHLENSLLRFNGLTQIKIAEFHDVDTSRYSLKREHAFLDDVERMIRMQVK
jgi:hypothetical protein